MNAVKLLILVWTFTAVCQADDVCSVICEDVTGIVGKEVTFTCSVSQKLTRCCIVLYLKFPFPDINNDTKICRQDPSLDSCEQRNCFTCRYTPTTAMTGQFRFFVQTKCGYNKPTEFTVNITEPRNLETVSKDYGKNVTEANSGSEPGSGSNDSVVAAVVGCLIIIIIIIIIIITIIYKRKSNSSTPRVFQKWMFLGRRHDDNSNVQEQIPQNVINITDSTV